MQLSKVGASGSPDGELDDIARDVIHRFLTRDMKSDAPTKEEIIQAQIAQATRSSISKRLQTSGAREATALLFARILVSDYNERAKYLRAALPSSPFVKALPASVDA